MIPEKTYPMTAKSILKRNESPEAPSNRTF